MQTLLMVEVLLYVHRNRRLIRDGKNGGKRVGKVGDDIPVARLSLPE